MLYVHGYIASGPGALEKVRLETVVHFNSNGHVPVTCGVPMRCPHTALILPFLLPHALRSPLRVLSLQSWSAGTPCAKGLPCTARWRRVGGSGALPRPESHFVAHVRMCHPPAVLAHLEPGRMRRSYARMSWLMPCTRERRGG